MNYWLMKSEPNTYSIDDLKKDKISCWEGVRNYQARNNMKKMEKGDLVFFYHSQINPGIVGIAKVCKEAYPDHYAFDKKSKYFDEKSTKENPRWEMVDIKFIKKLENPLSLAEIKKESKLKEMVLVNNSRLSVQPVEKREWEFICNQLDLKV